MERTKDFLQNGQWVVRWRNTQRNEEKEEIFDAVLVCVGHHSKPLVPSFPGMVLLVSSIQFRIPFHVSKNLFRWGPCQKLYCSETNIWIFPFTSIFFSLFISVIFHVSIYSILVLIMLETTCYANVAKFFSKHKNCYKRMKMRKSTLPSSFHFWK